MDQCKECDEQILFTCNDPSHEGENPCYISLKSKHGNKCPNCKKRYQRERTALKKEEREKEKEGKFGTAEEWMAHVEEERRTNPKRRFYRPDRKTFRSDEEFERAERMYDQRCQDGDESRQSKAEYAATQNKKMRVEYARQTQILNNPQDHDPKVVEEERQKRKAMHEKNNKNKKEAKQRASLSTEYGICNFSNHKVTVEELTYCPKEDLGVDDFLGETGRVRRKICIHHFLDNRKRSIEYDRARSQNPYSRLRERIAELKAIAKQRNQLLFLTEDEIESLIMSPCFYCGDEPSPLVPNGVDLMDIAEKEYRTDTVVPCCSQCNMSKRGMLPDAYLQKCKDITAFQLEHIRATTYVPFRQRNGDKILIFLKASPYTNYVRKASVRNLEFDITLQEFESMKNKGCAYCGLTERIHIGLDRVDNNIGYTKDNVVPCCTSCIGRPAFKMRKSRRLSKSEGLTNKKAIKAPHNKTTKMPKQLKKAFQKPQFSIVLQKCSVCVIDRVPRIEERMIEAVKHKKIH